MFNGYPRPATPPARLYRIYRYTYTNTSRIPIYMSFCIINFVFIFFGVYV